MGLLRCLSNDLNEPFLPLKLPDTYRKSALDLLVDYLHGFALALNCQQGTSLSVKLLDGPLTLYIDMLMLKKHHKKRK